MVEKNIFVFVAVVFLFIFALPSIFAQDCYCSSCSDCMDKLNNASCTTVYLTADIIDHGGTCIDNPAGFSNKTFDCQGHLIDGTGSWDSYGIYLEGKTNNTIKNCNITKFGGYGMGIYLGSSLNNNLTNNTLNNNDYGIYLYSSSNNTFTNNTANNNNYYGICLESSSNNNTLTNNIVNSNNERGIYLKFSNNNILINNTVMANNRGIDLESSLNNNITNNIANNNNLIGICLYEYSGNNNVTNNLLYNNNYDGICLSYALNNAITNNTANNNGYGINTCSSSNNVIENNTLNNNNNHGLFFTHSSNNNITNNIINYNKQKGIYLQSSSSTNNITDNNICTNNVDIYFDSSSNNNTGNNKCNDLIDDDANNVICSGDCPCGCINCSNCIDKLNNLSCTEVVLIADIINYGGSCIDNPYGFNNKTFDCQGHLIDGDGSFSGDAFIVGDKTNVTIKNCIITEFDYGIYLYSDPGCGGNNTIINNTIYNNNQGIHIWTSSNNNIINNTANNNTWDFYSESNSINNIVTNLAISDSTIISFEGKDIALKNTSSPASSPPSYNDINKYINITNNSADSWIYLNVSYQDSEIQNINEATLALWKYNNSWNQVPGSGVNVIENYVYGNVTEFSIFAPLGLSKEEENELTCAIERIIILICALIIVIVALGFAYTYLKGKVEIDKMILVFIIIITLVILLTAIAEQIINLCP